MLTLLGFLCGLFFLLFLSACFTVLAVNLARLRQLAIDRTKCDELRTHKSIDIVLDSIDQIAQSLRLAQSFTAIGIGIVFLVILKRASIVFGFELLDPHFWVLLLFLFVCVVSLYFGLGILVSRIASSGTNLSKLDKRAWYMLLIEKFLSPVAWSVHYFALRLSSLLNLRVQHSKIGAPLDAESLLLGLGETETCLSSEILNIIRNAIRLPALDVSDILLPRNQVQFLDLNDSIQENLDKARRTGHTRFPLCKGGIDHCLGIIHIKDIFQYQGDMDSFDFTKFQRQLIRFEESTPVEVALKKLQKFKIHMALVVDEFGGTIGSLTLEDILEELVGNIQDEFDHEDAMIIPITKNTYKVSGLTTVHDLESFFNVKIENDTVSTFGGLITAALGRIPEKNERINLLRWSIRITEVSKQRIISTIVRDLSVDNDGGEV